MADFERFREKVTICRKRKRNAEGRQYTLEDLGKAIGLSADELGHRLNGNGRVPLSQENVLAIVRTLAEWDTLSWDEAVALWVCMDYPLDPPDWQTELQRFLGPPPRSVHQTIASRVASQGEVPSSAASRRLFQARDLPKGYVPRPIVFNQIKQPLLDRERQRTTAIITALRGAGGFGKTTLALALCHDSEIQAAFPDGILWVELGEHPPGPREVINGILHALEPSLSKSVTLGEAQDSWRRALAERECLLVVDDVWQYSALAPLLEGGPHCKRLVTTRNDQVLTEDAKRIQVDALELEEAIALLCQGLSDGIQQTASQSKLESLVRRLGCWPILLTLARGLIVERVRRGKTLKQAVEIIEQAYQDCGVIAFDIGRATERNQAVQTSIEVSLRHVEEFLPGRYQAWERYQELAVFPEDTGHLSIWEVEDLCLHLHRLSLLTDCNLDADMIRLHDVLRSYLIQRVGSRLPTLHQCLLDAHSQHYYLACWADLPQSEDYLWQRLVFHLCQVGNQEAFQTTLIDLLYITRKVVYLGVLALEADLALTLASSPCQEEHFLLLVERLQQTIRRCSHLLRQVASEAEVGSLLLSHLHGEVGWDHQRLALEQDLPRPFLTAWHPLPRRSSDALLRTLWGHTGPVHSCAFSPDGKWIVSASYDDTLKVWDAVTGAELRILIGHTGPVRACAFSPDGRWIVSVSKDRTLRIWEGRTSQGVLTFPVDEPLSGCAFHPDGVHLVAWGELGIYFLRMVTEPKS